MNNKLKEKLAQLNKKYSSVSLASDIPPIDTVISTGSIGLDIALGVGGIPVSTTKDSEGNLLNKAGKIIELVGWGSAGKSTLNFHIIANAQKAGINVVYLDSENSFDKFYAQNLGVNVKDLILIKLDETGGEGAYAKMEELVSTGEIGLVIIDSYNGFQPLKILEDGLDSANIGLHSRMMSKLCAKANADATQYGTTYIFVGQLRLNIGVTHGDPSITQGGRALEFYSHIRIEASRSTTQANSVYAGATGKSERLGNLHKVKVFKNKVAPPFKNAEYNIFYGKGIDQLGEIMQLGKEYGLLKMRAGIITFNEEKYEEKDFRALLEEPGFFNTLRDQIILAAKKLPEPDPEPDIDLITDKIAEEIE